MTRADKAALNAELQAEATTDVTLNAEPVRSRWRMLISSQVFITLGFLIALIVIFSIMAPDKFGTTKNLSLLAQNVAILTIVSIGTTFVIATGGIDLSIPSGIILGEVFAANMLKAIPAGDGYAIDIAADETTIPIILLALLAAVFAGLLIGAINGWLVAYLRIPPMLATLGTLGAGLGVALLIQKGVNVATYALAAVADNDILPGGISNLVLIALAVVVVGYIGMHLSVFGRHTLAIGSSEEAARRVGINVQRHLLKVYIVGGLASGFAGFVSLSYFTTTSVGGHSTDNLQAITAVALGGTSLFGGVATIIGTVIGVFIPAVLQNGFIIIKVNPYWQLVAVGVVLVIAVAMDQWRRRGQNRR